MKNKNFKNLGDGTSVGTVLVVSVARGDEGEFVGGALLGGVNEGNGSRVVGDGEGGGDLADGVVLNEGCKW